MKFKPLIAMTAAIFLATGCQCQTNNNENNNENPKAMNKIVIFFAHAGDNYSVGNIEVGCYGPRA